MTTTPTPPPIPTDFTRLLKIRYPIVAAPMFLVSNVAMVVAASEAGAIGAFPALNYRPVAKYREALAAMRQQTKNPIAVNIIVNKSNVRQADDLKAALDNGVEMLITSLGSPKQVIADAHKGGTKVFCDVTNLEHALKVEDLGADGVIAVAHGAGGHAGTISPFVLIPWLKQKLKIPIVAAGGIANGPTLAAALALGAAGVSVGTRFIASAEAAVDDAYKQAVLNASPEDIVLTKRISGTPANVIRTEYIEKSGTELPWLIEQLKDHPATKKYLVPLIHYLGMRDLEKAASSPTWKTVWSAGQSVGLIDEMKTTREIVEALADEYHATVHHLPGVASANRFSQLA
jgi:nitronate monooxygenase